MKNFALMGAAGYIAPRHLEAIKQTNNDLVAACDPHDSVGILDRYFNQVSYFKEFERFDRHVEKLRLTNDKSKIDYVSICSPNYLHDAHIRFALRVGANVICEKPLVINPWNIEMLSELEELHSRKINTVLQLRLHPAIKELKKKIDSAPVGKVHDINLTYLTSRGPWYHYSWKGDVEKSGGLVTNIGIHFFDVLQWIFGEPDRSEVHVSNDNIVAGYMELKKAKVKWCLSVDKENLPEDVKKKGQTTYRSITVDGEEIEFSGGFTDLHTEVYKEVLAGRGFGLNDSKTSIEIVHGIRNADVIGKNENSHEIIKN